MVRLLDWLRTRAGFETGRAGVVDGDAAASEIKLPSEEIFLYPEIDPGVPIQDVRFWKQHVPEFSARTEIGLTSPKFQDYLLQTGRGPVPARSMLTQSELGLLYSLARYHFKGVGQIVDLGPLIGVGTFCMAQGLQQNPARNSASRIHSYDLFLMKNMSHFLPESDAGRTGSVFHRFLENNRDFLDFVVPVPGNLEHMTWTGDPIEILFVDLAKTWSLNQFVMKEFFPYLIPGQSILIQQDYVHVGEPWVALLMEILEEYFERLHFIYGATAVYRLIKPIPAELLNHNLRDMPLAEMDWHMENAIRKATPAIAEVLKCCQAALKIEKKDIDGADRIVAGIDLSVCDGKDNSQEFNPAIRANYNAVARWLEAARTNPNFRFP